MIRIYKRLLLAATFAGWLFAFLGPLGTYALFTAHTADGGSSVGTLAVQPPTAVTTAAQAAGALTLTWTASTTAAIRPVTYEIDRSPSGAGTWAAVFTGLSATSQVDTPPADGSYDYRLVTVVGNFSAPAAPVTALSDRTPPTLTTLCNGGACGAGWYRAAVTVATSATDAGSGVASITQTITPGITRTSTGAPISVVLGDGIYTVSYGGADQVGNASGPFSKSDRVDGTHPSSPAGRSATWMARPPPRPRIGSRRAASSGSTPRWRMPSAVSLPSRPLTGSRAWGPWAPCR